MKRKNLKLVSAAVSAAIFAPTVYAGTSGTYIDATTGGTWGNSANWLNSTVATGTDGIANFGTLTAAESVTLDTAYTIGQLNFNNGSASYGWTLASNTLTLNTSTGQPVINAVGATDTITSALAGNQGFVKTGSGQLTFLPTGLTGTVNDSAGLLTTSGGTFSGSLIGTGGFSSGAVTTVNTGNLTAFAGTMTSSVQFSINSPVSSGVFIGTSAGAAYVDNVTGTQWVHSHTQRSGGSVWRGNGKHGIDFGPWRDPRWKIPPMMMGCSRSPKAL